MPAVLKTLILEDNPSDAELMLAHLRAAGFAPDWKRVVSEWEFLDALDHGGRDARPYDLILADYHLPQFDGVRALQLVRARGLDIPFILVSGAVGEDIAVQAMKDGAADYLLKDRLARLGQAVVHALEDHRLRAEKQKAEADLRASQSRLSNILTHAAEAVIVVNEAQKIEAFNEAARNIFGYSEAEIVGQPLDVLLPARFVEAHRRRVEDFHALEEASRMRWARGELAGVRKDGAEFPCEISISKHAEGGRAFFTAVVMDITGRKQAEESLRESEIRYRGIFDGVREAIFVESLAGDIVDVNESACRMFGYTREEFLKKKVADLVPPGQEVLMLDEDGNGGLSEHFIETVNLRADGERFPVEVSGRTHIIDGKLSLLVVVRDISERKQAEAEIRRRNEDLSMLDAVNQALNRGESLSTVIAIVSNGLERIFGGHGATVYLLEKNGSEHLANQNMALPPGLLKKLETMLGFQMPRVKIELDASHPFHRALETKKIQAINDLAGVVEHYLAFAESAAVGPVMRAAARQAMPLLPKLLGVEAEMIVPLASKEGIIGVMDIGGSQPFTGEDVRRMESLAGHLTAAIQRKRAEESLRHRLAELEAVSKISTALRTAQTLDEMLPRLLGETLTVLESEAGLICLYDPASDELRAVVARGRFESLLGVPIKRGEGIGWEVYASGQTRVVGDFVSDAVLAPTALAKFPPGWGGICAPLHTADAVVGILFVAVPLPREITPDETRLLTSLAEMAGSALHRLRLHAETQFQAEQMSQVMCSVQDGVLLLDDEYRLLKTNPAGHEHLALLAEFTSAGALQKDGGEDGARLMRLGDRPLTHLLTPPPGGGWHGIRRNGRAFEALAHPLAPGPTARGWVLMVRDVTRQREAQEQLQRQERLAAVGQLAAGIAHDFNNLMGVILLQTQLLNRSVSLTPRERERLSVIQQQGRHAAALVGQILDFSRRAVLERQPLDLLPICKEQVKLLQRTLPEHIHIELTDEGGEYVVLADPTRMQQIVMNLAINARDAMPEGGNLSIGLAHLRLQQASALPLPDMTPGDWVRITVSDTGSGIAPEVLPHIFEPFFTTKEPGKGTGLGLAQVYGIVGQHGGQITVRSQVGQGTTFTLYLPALMEEAEALPAAMDEPLSGNGELLLLVEDNEPLREALAEFLRTCHYRVATASSGEEALALLAAGNDEQPALVLSDLVMPRMGGKALLAALRGQGYRMPVIFVSGHPLDESELRLLADQGVGAWLRKPFQMGEMVQAIARCLSPAAPQR